MTKPIDDIHRRILTALTTDARISMTRLADLVGLSKTPVAARVKRLEADGIIAAYRAILSSKKLGMTHIAFVEVKLADTREQALRDFNTAVKRVPEVAECYMIAGGFDYLLKGRTNSIDGYREAMGQRISTLPHVQSTSTFVAMETVIEETNPPLPG